MQGMKTLVQALVSAGLRDKVKVILAGRPVTERYCRLIGADYYAPNASSAAEIAAGAVNRASGATERSARVTERASGVTKRAAGVTERAASS
jgi:glutamate synthase domain-containing protein 2